MSDMSGWCNHLTVTRGECEMCGKYIGSSEQDAARYHEVATLLKRVEELEISAGSAAMTIRLAQERAERSEARVREYEEKLSTEMPPDFKDWWENSKEEWPEVARRVLEGRRRQLQMVQRDFDATANALDAKQADLDAALDCLDGSSSALLLAAMHGVQASGVESSWERVRSLLEKRREKRG